MVLEQADDSGVLLVQAVSDNSKDIISRCPSELFALDSFTDILSDDQANVLIEYIYLIQGDGKDSVRSAPVIFTLGVERDQQHTIQLRCAIHQSHTHSRSTICDMEMKQEEFLPTIANFPQMEFDSGRKPGDTPRSSGSGISTDEGPSSSMSAPKRARRKLDSLGILRTISQVQDRLTMAADMEQLVKIPARLVKELTGYDRVLVCQYDRRCFGRVVAEVASTNVPAPLYHGLRFRSTNVSGQREDIRKTDRVSVLYDRDAGMSPLVHRLGDTSQSSVDLAHSFLRKAPPIRSLHADDMDVRSAMSIHINGPISLWGIIECYASSPCGERISFLTRKLCSLIGDAAWTNIQRLSAESRLRAWKMIQAMRLEVDRTVYKLISTRQLLRSFRADSGFLLAGEQVETLGQLQHPQEALIILKYLAVRGIISVIASTDLRTDFPDLEYPLGFDGISGVLVVPLCLGGNEFMVFFRDAKLKEVRWAGNPYSSLAQDGLKDARKNFKPWTELTTGIGEEWSEDEIETATALCLLSERAKKALTLKQSLLHSDTVAQLLLKNSAHELRTPLNAIVNYLEIARNGKLGPDIREQLDRSHAASQSLTQAINEMLGIDTR